MRRSTDKAQPPADNVALCESTTSGIGLLYSGLDIRYGQEVLTTLFNQAVKKDRRALDTEWRSYMRGLRTDLEIILNER